MEMVLDVGDFIAILGTEGHGRTHTLELLFENGACMLERVATGQVPFCSRLGAMGVLSTSIRLGR